MRRVFLYALAVCLLAGAVGVARLLWFSASFGAAKIGLYYESCENGRLSVKIDFLDRYLRKEMTKLDSLVAFEDLLRLTYGMKPISTDVRKAGIGGQPPSGENAETVFSSPLVKKSHSVLEGLTMLLRRAQLQNTTFDETGLQVERQNKLWSQSPSIRPAEGYVTSGFGFRPDPMTGENLFHDGLDIANQFGTPVFAPADGIVTANEQLQDYGNAVIISHELSGIETVFAHLMKSAIFSQQKVKRGELIGYVGSSGKSTGPHLHYEVRRNGAAVNPVPYILPADQIVD